MTRNIPKELEDCYEVLGLKPGASIDEIKKAFRQVSKDGIHPDAGGTAAQFRIVQGCYEKLMNYIAQQHSDNSSSKPPSGNTSSHSTSKSEPKRYPCVELDKQSFQFDATHCYGEKLIQAIIVSNADSSTLLEGRWEVSAHPSDPPHNPDIHDWISVTPGRCSSNRIECAIQVDTSKLRRLERYE